MRLKTKIVLGTSFFLLAAVALCCIMFLRFTREQLEEKAVETALSEYQNVWNKFYGWMSLPEDPLIERSFLKQRLSSIANTSEYTLYADGDYLINNCGFAPDPYLDASADASEELYTYALMRFDGTSYLIVGKRAEVYPTEISICLVRSLSELDSSMNALTNKSIAIGAAVSVLSLALTYLFCTLSLKGVKKLSDGANALATGQMHTRIDIRQTDEIGALAKDFNLMADAIERNMEALREQNERKQQFINDLSHEMKTPVTSLLINSETMALRTVSMEDMRRMANRIHEQAQWIERLSQKLMQLVLLQSDVDRSPVPAADLFDTVRETVLDSLNRSFVTLKTEAHGETYSIDFDLFRSALVNLIENAIKASEPNSTVELIANEDRITVRDHGRGIPKAEIERITEPFYMVDRSRSKKLGGSGLGLALVKEIVRAHGATLSIESEEHVGTSITILFSYANDNTKETSR